MVFVKEHLPNKPDAVNPAIAPLLDFGYDQRVVTDAGRSTSIGYEVGTLV